MEAMTQQEIVQTLQKTLHAEITAVEMYSIHAKVIQEAGVAQAISAIRDAEMGHAKALAERIRTLGGEPELSLTGAKIAGRSLAGTQASTLDMLQLELAEEQIAIIEYANAIARISDDDTTLDMLEEHLMDEIRHSRWMKTQIRALSKNIQP